MKTKKEIEKYLGIRITYESKQMPVTYGEDIPFGKIEYEIVTSLSDESRNAIKKLMEASIQGDDLETANTCQEILNEKPKVITEQQINNRIKEFNRQSSIEFERKMHEERLAQEKAEKEARQRKEEKIRLEREQYEKKQAELKAEMETIRKAREQARLEKERQEQEEKERLKNSEEVNYLIEEFMNDNYFLGKTVSKIDMEIKDKVTLLENKIKELEDQGKSIENSEKIGVLNSRIEELEDAWEVYTQGFYNKDMFSTRHRDDNILRKYRTNYISIGDSFELYEKFKKGEEVPELFGKHHKARIEREEQARINAEQEEKVKAEAQAKIKTEPEVKAKTEKQPQTKAEEQTRIKEDHEIKTEEHKKRIETFNEGKQEREQNWKEAQERMNYEHWEYMANIGDPSNAIYYNEYRLKEAEKLSKLYPENSEYKQVIEELKTKNYEQPQEEKIKPREESIRDEVGDKIDIENNMQMQERKNPEVNLWMNRFSNWYNAIDRVSQNVKAKFIKMKSDIINSISDKLKERTNKRQQNIQEQDSNER